MTIAESGKKKSLKARLCDSLRDRIARGDYAPGATVESERALCLKYGVSRITVRAALQTLEQEGLIEAHPKKRIVAFAPIDDAASTKTKTDAITFVMWKTSSDTTLICEGIRQYAREHDVRVRFVSAGRSHARNIDYLHNHPRRSGGLIVIPSDTPDYRQAVIQAKSRGMPLVCLYRQLKDVDVNSVCADNFSAGYLAVRHLLDRWGRPVHYLGHVGFPSSAQERERGWRSAMVEYGLHESQGFLLALPLADERWGGTSTRQRWEIVHTMAMELFGRDQVRRDGCSIFTSDSLAQPVYQAAEQCGLKIGRDLTIVGFDDLPLARRLKPPLSSIRLPREGLGYAAAGLLHRQMTSPQPSAAHEILPVDLVVRASSAGCD